MESFEAPIEAADRGGACVRVPPGVVAALGGGGRIKVRATFDGIAYRGSVVSMGGEKVIGLLKTIREELGKGPGDTVAVTLDVDDAERTVDVPADLSAALDAAGLLDAFRALSYTHQREHVAWIEEAKRPDTRARRIHQTVERLREGD
ncbi:MAG TPA: YdeI/OmpD-associated family protein [Acidimicrobiales bacterium]|jgi:hypothetical protein|nr:YdeI/OmpD-associated family protein [Acidimicrobiales bacterium]